MASIVVMFIVHCAHHHHPKEVELAVRTSNPLTLFTHAEINDGSRGRLESVVSANNPFPCKVWMKELKRYPDSIVAKLD